MQNEEQRHVAGIDFGNQNTICAVLRNGSVDICLNSSSNRITPSIATFSSDRRYFGDAAQIQMMQNVKSTVTNLKKLILLPFNSDERKALSDEIQYELEELPGGYTGISLDVDGKKVVFKPEQILAYILKSSLDIIHSYDEKVDKIYLSVDSCWTNGQKTVLLNAAKIAGIECELVNSSVAAATAFVANHKEKLPKAKENAGPLCIVDIGDSSMKTCVAMVSCQSIDVAAYDEDNTISGSIITSKFAKYLAQRIKDKYKVDVYERPTRRLQFMNSVEKAKKTLTSNKIVQFELQAGETDILFQVKREELEGLLAYEIAHVNDKIKTVLDKASKSVGAPRALVLIGGSARVPCIKNKISELGLEVMSNVNADECIAAGCALYESFDITQRLPAPIEATFGEKKETIFEEGTILPSEEREIKSKGNGVLNCGIRIKINGENPHMKLNESGTIEISCDENTEFMIDGQIDDEESQQ